MKIRPNVCRGLYMVLRYQSMIGCLIQLGSDAVVVTQPQIIYLLHLSHGEA